MLGSWGVIVQFFFIFLFSSHLTLRVTREKYISILSSGSRYFRGYTFLLLFYTTIQTSADSILVRTPITPCSIPTSRHLELIVLSVRGSLYSIASRYLFPCGKPNFFLAYLCGRFSGHVQRYCNRWQYDVDEVYAFLCVMYHLP